MTAALATLILAQSNRQILDAQVFQVQGVVVQVVKESFPPTLSDKVTAAGMQVGITRGNLADFVTKHSRSGEIRILSRASQRLVRGTRFTQDFTPTDDQSPIVQFSVNKGKPVIDFLLTEFTGKAKSETKATANIRPGQVYVVLHKPDGETKATAFLFSLQPERESL